MKFLIIFLVVLSQTAHADKTLECIQKLVEFTGVEIQKEYLFEGKNEKGRCALSIYANLIDNPDRDYGFLEVKGKEIHPEEEKFVDKAMMTLWTDHQHATQKIKRCRVTEAKFSLSAKVKYKTRQRCKFAYTLEIYRDEVGQLLKMSLKERKYESADCPDYDDRVSCEFRP